MKGKSRSGEGEREKKMSAVFDRVGREGSLEEVTGRRTVSPKALRGLEKRKECEGEKKAGSPVKKSLG